MNPETVIRELEATGDYRVLRRFTPRRSYGTAQGEVRRGLVVDVETTGLDPLADAIIEFAAVPFAYCAESGVIVAVDDAVTFLEDPGRPVPPWVAELTGITTEMVAGKRIDGQAVARLAQPAALVIAHNAAFDRKFIDRRLPILGERPWACSLREIPWRAEGSGSGALDYLLFRHCGMFFAGHRAAADCEALIHLLATPLASGRLPMQHLLESAARTLVRVFAVGSPFEKKDLLRARGYRWDPGTADRQKCWYRELPEEQLPGEQEWLYGHVYGRSVTLKVEPVPATRKYAD